METFSREQVVSKIRARQGSRSLREYALTLKVSAAYISDIYLGKRDPGPKIIKHFKLSRMKTTTTIYRRVK